MASLKGVEGIGEVYVLKLKDIGVANLEGLLETCKTKAGRIKLAESSGISEKLILKWANHADLARVKGIGGQYSELLEAAGVDTVPELAKRKPDNLLAKMTEVNEAKKLVRKLPVLKQVTSWVAQAQALPRILQY
jgi:predicted flap endonuclease-1-like 5' DNA nuclease